MTHREIQNHVEIRVDQFFGLNQEGKEKFIRAHIHSVMIMEVEITNLKYQLSEVFRQKTDATVEVSRLKRELEKIKKTH